MRVAVGTMRRATIARPMGSAKRAKTNVNSACRRGRAMKNHSLIDADGNTHVKIAAVAVVISVVFMVVVSLSGLPRWDSMLTHGPVVKATTTTTVAGSGQSAAR